MNPKAALVLLGIIVVLFVVGVGCGATHGGQDTDRPAAGWATAIEHLFVKQATVDDLVRQSGNCSPASNSLIVPAPGNCTYQVVDRRRVNLKATGSVVIGVTQNTVSGIQSPKQDGSYEFDLNKPEAPPRTSDSFTVLCLTPGGCTLRVNS